jgi:hypothetical protein
MMAQTYNQIQTAENLHVVTFSNIVWTECRHGTEMELMTVRLGVHSWWTHEQGGFNTTDYTLAFFTRTYHKQQQLAAAQSDMQRE